MWTGNETKGTIPSVTVLTTDLWPSAWKNRLKAVKQENQVEIYQTLSMLRLEYDSDIFQDRLAKFIHVWSPIEPDFVQHFSTNYGNRKGRLYNYS